MASARIKKKHRKSQLRNQLQQSIEGLSAVNEGVNDIDIERQIKEAEKTLGQKKLTFNELQNQVTKTEAYRQSVLNILYSKAEPYVKKGKRYKDQDEGSTISNDGVYGAILRKYYEYIDKGWIDRVSTLDKYEAAQWFADNILSQRAMVEAIEQADRWREEAEAKHQRSLKARAGLIKF